MDIAKRLYSETKEPLCEVAKWCEYDTAVPKVLFILKEPAVRKDDKNYNFRESLENPEWKQLRMWRLLAYCSKGLQEIGRGETPTFEKQNAEACKKLLRYSSYMNLKRFGAERASDMSLIGLHAGLFWRLMLEEIRELKPNIIVCCKTYFILKELLECLDKLPEYRKKLGYGELGTLEKHDTGDGSECLAFWQCPEISQKRMGVINMAHPARKNYEAYFTELMGRDVKSGARYVIHSFSNMTSEDLFDGK